MSSCAAFFFNGDRLVHIANAADAGPQYTARRKILRPGAAVPAHVEAQAETAIVVVSGIIELMVGGAADMMGPGGFARIPPGMHFAYRNAGDGCAELLVRTAPLGTPRPTCRVTIDIAAA
jgi:mannose-6-phosphate isomerase-like protein (cupin superfamily)